MEKTFCDYCGVEIREERVRVSAPDGHVSKEMLESIRRDRNDPEWVPTHYANLELWNGDEPVDCCLDCLIKRLVEAKAIAEVEATC